MATQVLGDALKTNMTKTPKLTAGETYMQSVEPTLTEFKTAEEQKLKGEKEKAIATAESETQKQKSIAQAGEAEVKALREDPARAQYEGLLEEKSKAEFIPSQENAKDLAALFSLMNVIGFAIGAGGKQNAQAAMSAMNGMLEGHQKGRDDLYRQQRNIFEINQKQLDKKIDGLFKFMQENAKLYTKKKELAEQNAMVKFAEEGANFLKTYYEKYGPGPTLDYMKQIVKAKEHAADLTDREKTRAQQAADRLQREREAAGLKKVLAEMSAGRKDQKLLDAIGPALRNIAEQYPDGTAVSLVGASSDDKKKIQGAYRAVEEGEKVADFVARNPNAVGALAVAKNFLRVDAIKSLQSEDEAAVAASKAAVIDQQLEEGVQKGQISKDDAEAAKVLQKKLFALALADVQGSGQRGSVYLDRQFQNLYDQASRPETLVKIIRERSEENNRNLKPYKLNIERNNNPEQFPLVESRNVEDYIKERKPKTGVPDNVEKALKGKPDGTGARSGNKIYRIYGGVVKEVQE